MCHRHFFNLTNVIKASRGKSLVQGRNQHVQCFWLLSLLQGQNVKCGEGETGNGDLSNGKNPAINYFQCQESTALSRERQGKTEVLSLGRRSCESLSSDLKLLPGQCQHTGVLLPYAATTKFLLLIPGLSADTQPSVSTGWGSQAATDAKMSIRKPEASGLGWAAWEQGGKVCVVGDSCLLEYF